MVSIEVLLALIGIFVSALGGLVYNIYLTLVKSIEKTEKASKDSTNKLWSAIKELQDGHHATDKEHATLCQKHEDIMNELHEALKRQDQAVHDRQTVFESRIKGSIDFITQRINELSKRRTK